MDPVLDAAALGRLKWRCRRGMLENDLILERFFARHGEQLNATQGAALESLMALPDNDLLDLLLSRRDPEGALDRPAVQGLLRLLRAAPSVPKTQPEEPA